jgi:hypothetical protein
MDQRAMLAALKQGRPGKEANLPVIPTREQAEPLNVSERSVTSAAKVRAEDASTRSDAQGSHALAASH